MPLYSIGQTNVSGSILTNTTWTLSNSPYLVIDSVEVFPGVTLTIEPGVVVKFDSSKYLRINRGNLIAIGTANDSITFTCNNSGVVQPGAGWGWVEVLYSPLSRFNYCNFIYLDQGLWCESSTGNQINIKNSNFSYNYYFGLLAVLGFTTIDSSNFTYNILNGISWLYHGIISNSNISNNGLGIEIDNGTINNCIINSNQYGIDPGVAKINNCIIKYNQIGVYHSSDTKISNCIIDSNSTYGIEIGSHDSIVNCELKFNRTALVSGYGNHSNTSISGCTIENNLTGIEAPGSNFTIHCNKICNNSIYDVIYTDSSAMNLDVSNNYWCTFDQMDIQSRIYDGLDSNVYGVVSFLPIDTLNCPISTHIYPIENKTIIFSIYPNPAKNNFTIKSNLDLQNCKIEVFNMLGVMVYDETLNSEQQNIIVEIENGIYLVKILSKQKQLIKKLIIEKN